MRTPPLYSVLAALAVSVALALLVLAVVAPVFGACAAYLDDLEALL